MTNVDVVTSVTTGAGAGPAPRRRVRVSWLAGAVGSAVVAAAVVLWALGQVGDRTEVVVVVESVRAGDPIPASALSSTGVAALAFGGVFGVVYQHRTGRREFPLGVPMAAVFAAVVVVQAVNERGWL